MSSKATTSPPHHGEVMKQFLRKLYAQLNSLPRRNRTFWNRNPTIYQNLEDGAGVEMLEDALKCVHVLMTHDAFEDVVLTPGASFEARKMPRGTYGNYYSIPTYQGGFIHRAAFNGLAAAVSLGHVLDGLQFGWKCCGFDSMEGREEQEEEKFSCLGKVFDEGSSVKVDLYIAGRVDDIVYDIEYDIVLGSLCGNLLLVIQNVGEACKLFETRPKHVE